MFNNAYIYLISSLRELALDVEQKGLDVAAVIEEAYEQLKDSDTKQLRLFFGFYDCENLLSAYEGRAEHNPLGVLSREDVELLISGGDLGENPLSDEIMEQVSRFCSKGGVTETADVGESFAHALFGAYYSLCAKAKSRVLKSWSEEDRNIRNVIAALTARQSGREVESVLVGDGSVVDNLLRSSAADFSLRGELSYIDALIAAVVDEENMIEKERKIDLIKWQIVEDMSEMEYFSFDALVAYMVKLSILARWQRLDTARGKEVFAELLDALSREIKKS